MIAETFRKPKEGEGRWWGGADLRRTIFHRQNDLF